MWLKLSSRSHPHAEALDTALVVEAWTRARPQLPQRFSAPPREWTAHPHGLLGTSTSRSVDHSATATLAEVELADHREHLRQPLPRKELEDTVTRRARTSSMAPASPAEVVVPALAVEPDPAACRPLHKLSNNGTIRRPGVHGQVHWPLKRQGLPERRRARRRTRVLLEAKIRSDWDTRYSARRRTSPRR